MTPMADCLTLPTDKVLDHDAIDHILLSGFSRIPIHEPGQKDNFVGMLLVKRVSPAVTVTTHTTDLVDLVFVSSRNETKRLRFTS
jgi:CBS domain containing-hemolysin-like protein